MNALDLRILLQHFYPRDPTTWAIVDMRRSELFAYPRGLKEMVHSGPFYLVHSESPLKRAYIMHRVFWFF